MKTLLICFLVLPSGQEHELLSVRLQTRAECVLYGAQIAAIIEPYSNNKVRVSCEN